MPETDFEKLEVTGFDRPVLDEPTSNASNTKFPLDELKQEELDNVRN